MTDSGLPALLGFVSLGMSLGFARPAIRLWALLLAALAALVAYQLPLAGTLAGTIYLACWGSIVLASASVFLPRGVNTAVATVLAIAVGGSAGAVAGTQEAAPQLALASAGAAVMLPARWLVRRGNAIALRVAASWLIAIAFLSASLTLVPTPGFEADHKE